MSKTQEKGNLRVDWVYHEGEQHIKLANFLEGISIVCGKNIIPKDDMFTPAGTEPKCGVCLKWLKKWQRILNVDLSEENIPKEMENSEQPASTKE